MNYKNSATWKNTHVFLKMYQLEHQKACMSLTSESLYESQLKIRNQNFTLITILIFSLTKESIMFQRKRESMRGKTKTL